EVGERPAEQHQAERRDRLRFRLHGGERVGGVWSGPHGPWRDPVLGPKGVDQPAEEPEDRADADQAGEAAYQQDVPAPPEEGGGAETERAHRQHLEDEFQPPEREDLRRGTFRYRRASEPHQQDPRRHRDGYGR